MMMNTLLNVFVVFLQQNELLMIIVYKYQHKIPSSFNMVGGSYI